MSLEAFNKWLNDNRPNLEVLGEYINNSTSTLLQCKKCGTQIKATPKDIKRGRNKCICSREEQYRLRLASTKPTITLLSGFTGYHNKATFRCNVCGNTWTCTDARIDRLYCSECKKNDSRLQNKKELIESLKTIRPEIKITGNYIDARTQIQFLCKNCKSKQLLSPTQLLSGAECPGCKRKKRAKSLDAFLLSNNSDLHIVGQYMDYKTPIECICNNNHRFLVAPETLRKDPFCPVCRGKKPFSSKWKLVDYEQDFLDWLQSNHSTLSPITSYAGDDNCMDFKCRKCNRSFSATPKQLKNGYTCPTCELREVYSSKSSFSSWLSKHRKDLELVGAYSGAKDKTQFRCKFCGSSWDATPQSIYQGSGCSNCSGSQTSYMQQVLLLAFRKRLGSSAVKSRDKKAIGKELDIYIPEKNFAIEVGAWYWHKSRLKNDLQKIELCKKADINLVVIYDQYRSNTPPYEGCLTFYSDLRYARSGKELRDLVYKLMEQAGVDNTPFNDSEWRAIHDVALSQSFKTNDESFKEWLANNYPSLRMVANYSGANAYTEFQCRKCGTLMRIKPTYLQQEKYRKKCEKCGVLFTSGKTQEALFELWLNNAVPTIRIIGQYKTIYDPTLFHCEKCNTDFVRTPKAFKKGTISCPECDRVERENEFKTWLANNTDEICLNSDYMDIRTSVEFLCSKCGHKWSTSPHHMKEYKKCPKCERKKHASRP